jgi:hypothetical protein
MTRFSDCPYFCSHGKAPKGYGAWAFKLDGYTQPYFFTGNFGDAKKQAMAVAKAAGVTYVTVCP